MDSSYAHPQVMGQSPFFYYNPDVKSNNRQHGNFTQQPSHMQMPVYHQQQHFQPMQPMPSTPTYSRPSSSCSQPPMYQQMYNGGYQMNMTPIISPRPMYHKPTMMMQEQHAPRLVIESNMHESDMYYYPATPPLSSSGSAISSPGASEVLHTPMNPIFYGLGPFEGVKEGCEGEVQAEHLVSHEWTRSGSPPMTPVFLHPTSLSSNVGASELLSVTSCPSLSPSPSPYPRSVISEPQQQDFDFCDPRNLTVANGQSPTTLPSQSIKVATIFPALPTLCAADDEHKYMLGGETFTKAAEINSTFEFTAPQHNHTLPEFDHFSDLDSESEFVNGLVHLPATEHAQFFGNKRQRTGSDLTTISLDNTLFISEDDFEDFEEFDDTEPYAVACLPSPPASGSDTEVKKEKSQPAKKRAKRSKKARCEEDSSEFDNLVRSRKYTVPMNATAGTPPQEATSQTEQAETAPSIADSSEANAHTAGSEVDGGTPSGPVNRRGRKQSLTEDPSKTFVCELCNRRFRRQEHLKRHYRSLHSQDKPFECHECGKKFSRSDNLSQHSRTHGSGAIIMGVLEDGEVPDNQEDNIQHIHAMGHNLMKVAVAASGSETDGTDASATSDNQARKKRKRSN